MGGVSGVEESVFGLRSCRELMLKTRPQPCYSKAISVWGYRRQSEYIFLKASRCDSDGPIGGATSYPSGWSNV